MDTVDGPASIGRDPDAFEAFYRAHLESVQRFIARRVDNPEDAADLTAEVFLAAIKASARYRGDAGQRASALPPRGVGDSLRTSATHSQTSTR